MLIPTPKRLFLMCTRLGKSKNTVDMDARALRAYHRNVL